MKIGVALSLAYLADARDDEGARRHAAWLGPADDLLPSLREQGATHIEIRAMDPSASPETAVAAARRIVDAGLGVSVHSYLPEGREAEGAPEGIIACLQALPTSERAPVVVHALSADEGDKDVFAALTVAALHPYIEDLRARAPHARVALENNRDRDRADPSTDYAGMNALLEHFAPAALGACWDVGHAWATVLRGRMPARPDDAFLSRVIHTHIHDCGPPTHLPLDAGVIPLERLLACLAGVGYEGVYTLELGVDRLGDAARRGIEDSLHALRETLDRVG